MFILVSKRKINNEGLLGKDQAGIYLLKVDDAIRVILVSLLLTLNIFHTLF